MLIVWGKKITKKRLGHVADFCPLCRELRSFSMINVRRVPHLYFISLGSGESVGHYRTCDSCSVMLGAQVGQYASVSRAKGQDVVELAMATNPNVDEVYAERFQLEERLAAGRLSAEERIELLAEPFVLVNPLVEERAKSIHIDLVTGVVMLATVGAAFAVFAAANQGAGQTQTTISIIAVALGAVIILIAMFDDRRRYVRHRIVPILARALDPLKPSAEELVDIVARLKKTKLRIARSVKPHQVYAAMTARRLG